MWQQSHRADPPLVRLADRHYNRQKPGTNQFVPPGSCVCFKVEVSGEAVAGWTTSWPMPEYTKHAWAGAWVNSLFRKECDGLAHEFILAAVAATRWEYPDTPALGMVTFIDPAKVRPVKRRGVEVWGYSYIKAGFSLVGETKGGLLVFQILPVDMPVPEPALGTQLELVL